MKKAHQTQNKVSCERTCPFSGSKDPKKHGLSHHPIYAVHDSMMARCYRPKCASYKRYGGRGISVCKRWHDRERFFKDMLPTWSKGLILDRINVDGNYTPKNVRWATVEQSSLNKKETRFMDTPWGRMTVKEASRKSGIGYNTLLYRLSCGAPQSEMFRKPVPFKRFSTS